MLVWLVPTQGGHCVGGIFWIARACWSRRGSSECRYATWLIGRRASRAFTSRRALFRAISGAVPIPRRLYILCWSELSRRRLLPAVSPAAGHLATPTVAGLPGLCENFRPTTSKSSPILRLLSSHWATSVVRTRVVGVANVVDSLRRLCSLQHRIYNILGPRPVTSAHSAVLIIAAVTSAILG